VKTAELMAPAGTEDALVCAVENGADAVYLGGKFFNARAGASNFEQEELKAAVAYCHRSRVKIYLTVNTLIKKEEILDALNFLDFLENIGVDGVLLQDLGLAELAQKHLPGLKLMASTQLTVHNAAGVNFLKDYGFSRAVLARELFLEEIKAIRQKTPLELEVFIHGALCFSYSGQCLLSSMIGGRSGNRGRCAQPCRLSYTLLKDKKEITASAYLLSTKDLMTADFLPELLAAGVDALKIEGRMRKKEYVATTVRIYRRLLDRFQKLGKEKYFVTEEEKDELAQAFNRDFTPGYFKGQIGSAMMSYERPNNRGLYLGRVTQVDSKQKRIHLKLERSLNKGDGIEFWVKKGGRTGMVVEEMKTAKGLVDTVFAGETLTLPQLQNVREKDRVFKTSDAKLNALSVPKEDPERVLKVKLKLQVKGEINKPLEIFAVDELGKKAVVKSEVLLQRANKTPLAESILKEHLGRLGGTPYNLEEIECELKEPVMLPVSQLNQMRRELIQKLGQEKRFDFIPDFKLQNNLSTRLLLIAEVSSPQGIDAAFSNGADEVYYNWFYRPFSGKDNKTLFREKELLKKIVPVFPRISHGREERFILSYLEKFFSAGAQSVLVGNIGAIELMQKNFPQINLYGDYSLNVFNPLAIRVLAAKGLKRITISPELSFGEIEEIVPFSLLPLEFLGEGRLNLMLSRHCVVGAVAGNLSTDSSCSRPCKEKGYALKDRKNYIFPLREDIFCRMYLENAHRLRLLEDVPRFLQLGASALRLLFNGEEPEEIRKVTFAYRQKIDFPSQEIYLPSQQATKGHYYRGVM